MRNAVLCAIAGAATIALAAPATAAPDRLVTLSREAPTATWTSDIGVGTYVGSPDVYTKTRCFEPTGSCDDTLIRLTVGGDVKVSVSEAGPVTMPDFYSVHVALYGSDVDGQRYEPVHVSVTRSGITETISARNRPAGFYLVEVSWFEGVGYYDATATLAVKR